MKLRMPDRLRVALLAGTASLASCQTTEPPVTDYNCVYRDDPDGGGLTVVARDGGGPVDVAVCSAPECNGSLDGGRPVYSAPNGDRAPNCAI